MIIQKLTPSDLSRFKSLITLFERVFDMQNFRMPVNQHIQKILSKEDFIVFVALEKNRVVGGLTAYKLDQYYSEAPLVYIYDLAVDPDFQRQGIGRKLMEAINEYSGKIGAEEVFVQADLEDTHALDFYRSTDSIGEEVVHFTYPLK